MLLAATSIAGFGLAAAAWPLISSLLPAADVISGSTTKVDLSPIGIGQRVTISWGDRPVFVWHRSAGDIAAARRDDSTEMRDMAIDAGRSQHPAWLIVLGICTHLDCVLLGQDLTGGNRGKWGGWTCPCCGSEYDRSGRIRQGPAPRNLEVPPYTFFGDNTLVIGPAG